MQPMTAVYQATFTFDPPERVANWRPLVHWLMAIPHFIVLYALGVVAYILAVVSWFAVLFTGRLPAGMANYQAMFMRYSFRTITHAVFLREEYPPFSFATVAADPGDDPRVRVDVIPQLEGRNRLTTFFRFFLVLPHWIALMFLGFAGYVVVFIGSFAVLFTGRWPAGMRDFLIGVGRWAARVQAYYLLLTDEYPPFTTA